MADLGSVQALTFDVFGTVVDWRSSITREGEALGRAKGLAIDWASFADAWRGLYQPNLSRVRNGELPWTKLDDLHRMSLDRLLVDFRISGLSESEVDHLNRAWHRLDPWPDAVPGLTRPGAGSSSPPARTATSRSWSTWPGARGCRGTPFWAPSRHATTSRSPRPT